MDPNNLNRFLQAQERDYPTAMAELREGRKTSHWIWYIFPQIQGLGSSAMNRKYAIASLQEAEAYLGHPVLGPRLIECTQQVLDTEGRSIQQIFGDPDWMKFRSCMTLFAEAAPQQAIFSAALQKYFNGVPDPLTLQRL